MIMDLEILTILAEQTEDFVVFVVRPWKRKGMWPNVQSADLWQ